MVWDGLRIIEISQYKGKKTTEMAEIIKAKAKEYRVSNNHIVCDSDGVGGGVSDQIDNSYNFVNNSRAVNGENYNNLKSQCYFNIFRTTINIFIR